MKWEPQKQQGERRELRRDEMGSCRSSGMKGRNCVEMKWEPQKQGEGREKE